MGIFYTHIHKEKPTFELLPAGIYAAEVFKFDTSISNGAKTNGSQQMELMFTVYSDDKFSEKLSTVRDTIIFHELTDWKVGGFAESFSLVSREGEEIEFDSETCLGARGWLKVKIEDYTNKSGEKKQTNKVDDYPLNKSRIPKFKSKPDFDDPGE